LWAAISTAHSPHALPWRQNGFALRDQDASERHSRQHEISDDAFPSNDSSSREKIVKRDSDFSNQRRGGVTLIAAVRTHIGQSLRQIRTKTLHSSYTDLPSAHSCLASATLHGPSLFQMQIIEGDNIQ
jgi:hypothetical protein